MRTERNLATYVFSNLLEHERVKGGPKKSGVGRDRWVSKIEPALGSTHGAADALAMNRFTRETIAVEFKMAKLIAVGGSNVRKYVVRPEEFKMAKLIAAGGSNVRKYVVRPDLSSGEEMPVYELSTEGRVLRPSRIRPAQIAWHDELQRAGGKSRMIFGVRDDDGRAQWEVWFTDDCSVEFLRHWLKGFELSDLTRLATAGVFSLTMWDTGAFGPSLVNVPNQKEREQVHGQGKSYFDQEG